MFCFKMFFKVTAQLGTVTPSPLKESMCPTQSHKHVLGLWLKKRKRKSHFWEVRQGTEPELTSQFIKEVLL